MKAQKSLKSILKALRIAEFVLNKKAEKIVVLDMRKVSNLCDYFVICSGDSKRQVSAIYEGLVEDCKKNQITIQHCNNDAESLWILVDFFDVILHIFYSDTRYFYNLEYLWKGAKKIELNSSRLT